MVASLLFVSIFELAVIVLLPIAVIALIVWLVVKNSSKPVQRGAVHPPQDNGKPQ